MRAVPATATVAFTNPLRVICDIKNTPCLKKRKSGFERNGSAGMKGRSVWILSNINAKKLLNNNELHEENASNFHSYYGCKHPRGWRGK